MTRVGLLSAQKDEGPFVLEFVAHHRALGFSDIFIVTNPSSDGTNELAEALSVAGMIKHIMVETPVGRTPQDHAFEEAQRVFRFDTIDWLIVLDADELLNIHIGDGSVGQYLETFGSSVDLVSINMACFGDRPHSSWQPGRSASHFEYRLASDHWRNGAAKSFVRWPENVSTFRPHGPSAFFSADRLHVAFHGGLEVRTFDPPHSSIYGILRRPGSFKGVHRIAQINHFAIRTWDAFCLRIMRGRGAAAVGSQNLRHTRKYFTDLSSANVHDDSIGRYDSRVVAALDELLSNDEVRARYHSANELFKSKLRCI